MKRLAKAGNVGVRSAWLWRNRAEFAEPAQAGSRRLLVDVSTIIRHDAQTGIQRVVRAVWSELSRRKGNGFEVVPIFASTTHGYCYAPPDFLTSGQNDAPIEPARARPGDIFLGLDLSAHILPKYRRQLRAWRAHGAKIHMIVYDLLPIQRPDWFTPSAVAHFRKWFEFVSQESDLAICISDDVARLVRQRLQEISGEKPAVARLRMGADMAASLPSSGTVDGLERLLEHLRFRPAILMVGTLEPRKGYEAALEAFEHLWRTRHDAPDLVLVGKAGWKTAALQELIRSHKELGRRLHWFDRMSDEGLCRLYDASRGLLMASRGEGWGLPLIEAAAHRRFVLARDLPVFREQNLPNIIYFADDSPAFLGEKLVELSRLGAQAAPEAVLPTWSDSIDALLPAMGLVEAAELPGPEMLKRAS